MTATPPSGHALDTPPRQSRPPRAERGPRLRYVVAGLLCLGAIVYLVAFGLRSNIVYFRTPTEAVARKSADGSHRFRLAGAVTSVHTTKDAADFDVSDDKQTIHVHHEGDTPELFKLGAPVVCEGQWRGDVFVSDRILIKHDNNYTPREQLKSVTTVTVEPQR